MESVEEIQNKDISTDEDITVLYDRVKRSRTHVNEILPDWILSAVKVDDVSENNKKLSEIPEISKPMKKLLKKNFKILFPVQQSVIPAIIQSSHIVAFRPHDICVCAPTGSGKTLAYVTPILQILSEDTKTVNGPRALVVLPVRDLALQVFNVFNGLSKSLGVRCTLLIGQKNLLEEKKDMLEGIQNKVDIIVCTPGRLVDHIRNTKELELKYLRYLVIDEADRVLEEHKHDWFLELSRTIDISGDLIAAKKYKNILSCFVTDGRIFLQKILLSATLTRDPHLFEQFDLHYPELFVVGGRSNSDGKVAINAVTNDMSDNYAAPKTLTEFFVVYNKEYARILFIIDQVRRHKQTKILCFTNTRDSASRLNQLLNEFVGIRSAYLSCQLHPKIRNKLRHDFEKGQLDVLVTVDSMGRGMDLQGVKCVIQYDLAHDVHTHIHRVGRTARGGQAGHAYALCPDNQIFYLKKSLASCNRSIKKLNFPAEKCYKYLNEYNKSLAKLQGSITKPRDEDVEMAAAECPQ